MQEPSEHCDSFPVDFRKAQWHFFGGIVFGSCVCAVGASLSLRPHAVFSALSGSGIALFDGAITWLMILSFVKAASNALRLIFAVAWAMKLGIILLVFKLLSQTVIFDAPWLAGGVSVLLLGALALFVCVMRGYARKL